MEKIVKEVVKNIDYGVFDNDYREYVQYINQFISGTKWELKLHQPIFYDYENSEQDEIGNITKQEYKRTEFYRIKEVIEKYTLDNEIKKGLFLFYVIYKCFSDLNHFLESNEKYGANISKEEQKRSQCVNNRDKWNKIEIVFNSTKAKCNEEKWQSGIFNDDENDYFKNEKQLLEESTNPIQSFKIDWRKNPYCFDSRKLNYVLNMIQDLKKKEPKYYETFKLFFESDEKLKLKSKSSELFEISKQIALLALDVDSEYEGYGTRGVERDAKYKKIAKILYPIYIFIQENKTKFNCRFSKYDIIIDMFNLQDKNLEKVDLYLGKEIKEGELIDIWVY